MSTPPITIGPFANVPAPGAGVKSDWAQQITHAVVDDKAAQDAHIVDTTAAHNASAIAFAPVGTIASTTVQAAIAELAAESGTSALDAHLADTVDAHDASAISFVPYTSPAGSLTNTDVQGVIQTLADRLGTTAINVTNHVNDTVDAHDASAISFMSSGTITALNVQSAIEQAVALAAAASASAPRGYIGVAGPALLKHVVANTQTDIPGTSVTFTADPTRRYKTTATVWAWAFASSQTSGSANASIYDATNHSKAVSMAALSNSTGICTAYTVIAVESGLTGTQVRKLSFWTGPGEADLRDGQVLVEDIGAV